MKSGGALGFRGRWGNVFCKLPKRGGHQWLPATKSAPHTLRHHRHPPRRTSPPPPTAKKTERPSNTSAHDLAATPFNLSLVVLEGSQALIKFLIGNHILSCETHIYGPPAFKEEKLQSLKAPPRGGDVFRAIACPDKQLLHLNEQLLHPEI